MIIFKHSETLRRYLDLLEAGNKTIGFVPTMGALHRGHIYLLEQSKKQTDVTVCSIFINPTQFNDKNDYDKYPVNIEQDIYAIGEVETDILFLPNARELYPSGTNQLEHYELGYLETILEGRFRPGHFQGVSQVMTRLLAIIRPTILFMGQKDYQQSLVVALLIKQQKSNTKLIVCPTVRESNGLAMSSRNQRLNNTEKYNAAVIYRTLQFIKNNIIPGKLNSFKTSAHSMLEHKSFTIDYVEMADARTLQLMDEWDGKQPLVALIAVFIRDVRLIDNMLLAH